MQNKLIIVLFFLLFGQDLSAQDEDLQDIKYFTEVLCSDSLFGRGYVNNGVGKAARFIAKSFEEEEIAPFFEGSYFQSFSFEVNTFPGALSVLMGDDQLMPGVDYIIDPNSGSFKGTLSYTQIDSTSIEDESTMQEIVSKIRSDEITSLVIDLQQLSASKLPTYVYQLSTLGQLLPVVILTDDLQTYAVGRTQMRYPVVLLKKSAFKEDATITINIEAKFEKNYTSKNVGAIIPGKIKNGKTILLTAHYDHLGGMGQEAYFPGANDNASGVAMMMALAKQIKKQPLKHTIVFVAFAGEEAGLMGSTYFVSSDLLPLQKIDFVLNLDIMGSGDEGITVVNGKVYTKQFKRLSKINAKQSYLKKVKSRGETKNSDHYPFHKKGVPSFFVYSMGYNKNYHVVNDNYAALTFEYFDEMQQLFYQFLKKF